MSKFGEWKRKLKENAIAASERKKQRLYGIPVKRSLNSVLKEVPQEDVLKDVTNWLSKVRMPRPLTRKEEVHGTDMLSFNISPGMNSGYIRNKSRMGCSLGESNDASVLRPHSGNSSYINKAG